MSPYLSAMNDNGWTPDIGDPTLGGWLTVAAYLLAALLCARVAKQPHKHGQKTFWWSTSVIMLFLGINKQLDLQSLLTQIGRSTLRWLELGSYKQPFQIAFIVCICIGMLIAAIVTLYACRHFLIRIWLAVAGLAVVGAFVLIRAASFHHVDRLIGRPIVPGTLNLNFILEIPGILMVILAASRAKQELEYTNPGELNHASS